MMPASLLGSRARSRPHFLLETWHKTATVFGRGHRSRTLLDLLGAILSFAYILENVLPVLIPVKILGKQIKKARIVSLASSNESESTEGKSTTSINGNIIFWVHGTRRLFFLYFKKEFYLCF